MYVTIRQPVKHKSITLEDLMFGDLTQPSIINWNTTNTLTRVFERIPNKYIGKLNVDGLILKLKDFNRVTEDLRNVADRKSLYNEFFIPKRSGGLRKISAPNDELMLMLRKLKLIFENDFKSLYHTSAFAYIRHRCALDAVKRHQANESRWFLKLDLSKFFPSTTLQFCMKQLAEIYPFSEVIKIPEGERELEKALELGFLDGGLPQGTPLSPTLTNIIMIPIDYEISRRLRERDRFVYTRYADDFLISSKYNFDFKAIEKLVVKVLADAGAPFSLNTSKTRYGSSSGRNWNLGVMLNKDNEITIGYRKKKQFRAMLSNFSLDTKNGILWDKEDVQHLQGLAAYYHEVEGDKIEKIIADIGNKYNIDINKEIKKQII